MLKLVKYGNIYAKNSSWKDFAFVKSCLFSLGMISGTFVKEENKKKTRLIFAAIFFTTYIILIKKFIDTVEKNS